VRERSVTRAGTSDIRSREVITGTAGTFVSHGRPRSAPGSSAANPSAAAGTAPPLTETDQPPFGSGRCRMPTRARPRRTAFRTCRGEAASWHISCSVSHRKKGAPDRFRSGSCRGNIFLREARRRTRTGRHRACRSANEYADACWLPARRASRVRPTEALCYE
jgi:hypothetical protein